MAARFFGVLLSWYAVLFRGNGRNHGKLLLCACSRLFETREIGELVVRRFFRATIFPSHNS